MNQIQDGNNQRRAARQQRRAVSLAVKRAFVERHRAQINQLKEAEKQEKRAEREAMQIAAQYWWYTRPNAQKLLLFVLGWFGGASLWGLLLFFSMFTLLTAATVFCSIAIALAAMFGPPYGGILLPLGITESVLATIWLAQEVKLSEIWGAPINLINEVLDDSVSSEHEHQEAI
jgi:hypothetical protein